MGRAPALCFMHQTSGSPHLTLTLTLTSRKAERQRINQEPWDKPTSALLVVVHGVTGLTLWTDRTFHEFYPVKEKRTSEEAARGGRRRTCHPWRGLGDSRSRSRPDGWHVAGWLARQAQVLRRVLGRGPEGRGGSLEARWLRGLRGWGHGMLHRLFEPDAEVGGRWSVVGEDVESQTGLWAGLGVSSLRTIEMSLLLISSI